MGEGDIGKRALELAEAADHRTVTVTRLLDTAQDGGMLFDGPVLEHLEPGEEPALLFHNTAKGVSVGGTKTARRPDRGGGTVVVVTDRRVLGVVGRRDGDVEFEARHADVEAVEFSRGRLKSRISVETADQRYHFWVDRRYFERDLAEAVEWIERGGDGNTGDAPASDEE